MPSRWGDRAYILFASLATYAVILMLRPFTGNFVQRLLSRLLLILFAFAAFVAVVYEPLFLMQCGWSGLHEGPSGPCVATWAGRAWLQYLQVEPYYGNAPLFLQLLNEFDTLLFGWFYVLAVYVFFAGREECTWFRNLSTFVAGMMGYAMAYYLTWELLSYRQTGARIVSVFAYNGLWLLTFVLLMVRLYAFRQGRLAANDPIPAGYPRLIS